MVRVSWEFLPARTTRYALYALLLINLVPLSRVATLWKITLSVQQRSCFNGPKTYKLGWYADRHVEITAGVDSFNGRLYGFTQWAATTPSDKMIIRINDPSCSVCDW